MTTTFDESRPQTAVGSLPAEPDAPTAPSGSWVFINDTGPEDAKSKAKRRLVRAQAARGPHGPASNGNGHGNGNAHGRTKADRAASTSNNHKALKRKKELSNSRNSFELNLSGLDDLTTCSDIPPMRADESASFDGQSFDSKDTSMRSGSTSNGTKSQSPTVFVQVEDKGLYASGNKLTPTPRSTAASPGKLGNAATLPLRASPPLSRKSSTTVSSTTTEQVTTTTTTTTTTTRTTSQTVHGVPSLTAKGSANGDPRLSELQQDKMVHTDLDGFDISRAARRADSVAVLDEIDNADTVAGADDPDNDKHNDNDIDNDNDASSSAMARRLVHRMPGSGWAYPFISHPEPDKPYIPMLIDHYLTNMAVDVPELDNGSPFILRRKWFPMVITSPATLYIVLLTAASHYAAFHPSTSSTGAEFSLTAPHVRATLLHLKDQTLKAISTGIRALHAAQQTTSSNDLSTLSDTIASATATATSFTAASPAEAQQAVRTVQVTDTLIGAVAKTASYEAMFGTPALFHTHMRGLASLIEARGGLHALGLDGLLMRMVLWIDLNAAFILGSKPYFLPTVPLGGHVASGAGRGREADGLTLAAKRAWAGAKDTKEGGAATTRLDAAAAKGVSRAEEEEVWWFMQPNPTHFLAAS